VELDRPAVDHGEVVQGGRVHRVVLADGATEHLEGPLEVRLGCGVVAGRDMQVAENREAAGEVEVLLTEGVVAGARAPRRSVSRP
jgi:predicted RecA/RadA family phage recombinase